MQNPLYEVRQKLLIWSSKGISPQKCLQTGKFEISSLRAIEQYNMQKNQRLDQKIWPLKVKTAKEGNQTYLRLVLGTQAFPEPLVNLI